MSNREHSELAKQFANTWTGALALSPENIGSNTFSGHPLADELTALQNSETASLPYFTNDNVLWVTTAPGAEDLEMAVDDLRAWVLPSFGWEDGTSSIVLPADAPLPIRALMTVVSPSGYFRWWTKGKHFQTTLKKLAASRSLNEVRPTHSYQRAPSLFELRQQYEVALLVKDQDAAQTAVDSIDRDQLDSAANTGFMQIRLWSEFREFQKIVDHPQLRELLQLRMPHSVRLDFVDAFHGQFLEESELRNDFVGSLDSYQVHVAPLVGGLLSSCQPSDGAGVRHTLAHKAILESNTELTSQLLEITDDDFLQGFLKSHGVVSPVPSAPELPKSLSTRFHEAHQKNDWRALQEIGAEYVFANEIADDTDLSGHYVRAVLWFSLNKRANSTLQKRLVDLESAEDSAKTPQTWHEFINFIREKKWEGASAFLSLENRPLIGDTDLATSLHFLETFEELLTDPELESQLIGRETLNAALPAIVREFLTAPDFPNPDLDSIYKQLMNLWYGYKSGSSSPIDANLLLTLAEPVLQNDGGSQSMVADTLRGWWNARKVRALLPYLLSSLELLSENVTNSEICESLFVDGANFVRLDPDSLSPTERRLWRTVGAKIGLDNETIVEFLGSEQVADSEDVLSKLEVNRIAIVSLREEAARNAAELLRERLPSEIIVVSETHNNAAVQNARNSDVILFVWASNSHAVYRAFDNVRDRLVYVQGKGASSIVISFERWAMEQ